MPDNPDYFDNVTEANPGSLLQPQLLILTYTPHTVHLSIYAFMGLQNKYKLEPRGANRIQAEFKRFQKWANRNAIKSVFK